MFCKHCGKEIPENSKFCRHCGNKLSIEHKNESLRIDDRIDDKSSEKVEHASFWVRLGAYTIDIIGMITGVVAFSYVLGYVGGYLFGESFVEVIDNIPETIWGYFGYAVYSTFTLTIWSTTFGKYMYGLRVVTEGNEDLDFGQALKRSLLQPLSTLLFGVGYWNMNKNPKKQAWHDKRANTVVVRERKNLTLAYIVTIIAVIIWAYLYSLGLEQ